MIFEVRAGTEEGMDPAEHEEGSRIEQLPVPSALSNYLSSSCCEMLGSLEYSSL